MTPISGVASRLRRRPLILLITVLALGAIAALSAAWLSAGGASVSARRPVSAGQPDFGPNVYVFHPGMPQDRIQTVVNRIASQQASNQFGQQRYAIMFEPGTYGSVEHPLFLRVSYYTTVAGLGSSPGDVVINGAVDSFNQCSGSNAT